MLSGRPCRAAWSTKPSGSALASLPPPPLPVRLPVLVLILLGIGVSRVEAQGVEAVLTVVDAGTGEALPGATAQVVGTSRGGAADREGRVRLAVGPLPDTLVVRFLGYAAAQVVVTDAEVVGGTLRRTVRLSRDALALGEVTVTDEPVGERIWRRVLARRQALARRLGRYGAEAYTRLRLARDGPLDVAPVAIGLTETLSTLDWRVGQGLREEVVARRRVPDLGPFRFAREGPLPDLYFEDALALDGRTVVSPTHPDAIASYAFRLGETFEADGVRYLDLAILPRRGGLLAGRIRIVDSLFVIAEADLRVDGGGPGGAVQQFDAAYRWTYAAAWTDASLRDSLWLPARFEREGRVTAGVPGVQLPTVAFRQVTVVTLSVPRGALPVETRGARFRNPRGVYGGAEVFRAARNAVPLDSLESVADTSPRLRRADNWRALVPPQTGFTIALGIPGFTRAVGMDLEGEDDE